MITIITETKEKVMEILIFLATVGVFLFVMFLARQSEKSRWNEGIHKDCGGKWEHFDNDSQGGRGYSCDECDYSTWISYSVDN
jgi:hypothetical protein